ncbi:MAG: hypothetical protein E6344_19790 [Clostridium sp.]|uniref:hypothetical protein n=1 Tax=Clostridium tertium TaxID=1559 RepID=UPI00290F5ECD|nr:hypothetical protein [Clostridium sp.]
MENKILIKMLVKLQVLCARYVERNTSLRCATHRDLDRIIMANKLTCTYGEAVENLINNIKKYCKENNYLMEEAIKLEGAIKESNIKNLRFGLEPKIEFTKEEKELDMEMVKRKFFMINEMVGIKEACELLTTEEKELTESAVKQACQQERLLNTKKVGKTWLVHIPECRSYWNVPDMDESHLYKDWEY